MNHEIFRDRIGLRIDVDFPSVFSGAVPFMLDVLKRREMKATFFVVMGRNSLKKSLLRVFRGGYPARLWRLRFWRLIPTLVRAGIHPAPGNALGELVMKIEAGGHELGIHGYDHAWWAEEAWRAGDSLLESEIERAYAVVERCAGSADIAWASPNWRTSLPVLRMLHTRGVPYFSDCWGSEPFITVDESGSSIPVCHLPVTLPSFESMAGGGNPEPTDPEAPLRGCERDKYDVMCMHDYYEGLLRRDIFSAFLDACGRRGLRTSSLREMAIAISESGVALPHCKLTKAEVPGFVGNVSWQGKAMP